MQSNAPTLDILTPQGYLSEIQNDPNLDVAMNLFKIPRAFAVSGFGNWNVGQHSMCTAFLALYWAKFNKYNENRRNKLMLLALTHDLHESSTGDILPGLKTQDLKIQLETIQNNFLTALEIHADSEFATELKVLDIIAFMYEIHQAQTANMDQRQRLETFFAKQQKMLFHFCEQHGVTHVDTFLDHLGVFQKSVS
ncbi:YfbR-like 5'-deoxynucleotidase [Deltaproteobacteria bacterium TL4]